jgi:ribosome-associated translation inhibitor RaiA
MKAILFSIFTFVCLNVAVAQSETTDTNVVASKPNRSVVKTEKVDSALIHLNNSLTRLGESINQLVKDAGLNVEKGVYKLDQNLKDEQVFVQLGKAIDRAAKSLENAAERLQRKIDDSASRKKE